MDRNPQSPWNPGVPAEITAAEFERLVLEWLRKCSGDSSQPIEIEHLGALQGSGGRYKINVLVKLLVFGGATVTVVVECKHQKRPVEREEVMAVEAKLRDAAAHKGMMFSTSGFQRGAIQYATAHGIATVTVVQGEWLYETRGSQSLRRKTPPWAQFNPYEGLWLSAGEDDLSTSVLDFEKANTIRQWLTES